MEYIYKKNNEKTKQKTIRIPIEIYEKIEKEAKEQCRDVSKQINYILEKHFKIKEL